MILTEEEAKTKWCPFARGATDHCVSSSCMAWRWGTKPTKWAHVTRNIYTPTWDESDLKAGYCGLAGEPK